MRNSDDLTIQEREWIEKYGCLPEDPNQLIELAKNIKRVNWEKYYEEKDRIENMQWKNVHISLPLVPKCTPRARLSPRTHTFYVKGAAENKKIIKRFINVNDIIYTNTKFMVDLYFPTPVSAMKGYEILLAEQKLIRPTITKDWDNLGKTYSDMIQEYLLINDNIICDGCVHKYFSLRPHVEIYIDYQEFFDSSYNQKKITNSKSYNNLIDPQKSINLTL